MKYLLRLSTGKQGKGTKSLRVSSIFYNGWMGAGLTKALLSLNGLCSQEEGPILEPTFLCTLRWDEQGSFILGSGL